ncbi:Aspartic proteinase nepenthesin-2 [Acorus calamus]|uniref:Aspartic proteinase nepenthesin-2 n=1 Tax=Acorus calamus TaxID=4465 RepID=A0AAV9C2S9_ACOCL|nr:Aspartic proteinase nepenthesin-2 [Acorus calamus]
MAMSPPQTLLLFLTGMAVAASSSSSIHISLTHIDSDSNHTHTDLVMRAVARANRHLSTVQYRSFSLSTDSNEYYMKIGVGTPPMTFHVALWWSFYNVDLVGISVDGTALPIPKNAFAMNWFVKPGVILDSGTTFTYLIRSAYEPLKRVFVAKAAGFAAVDGAGYGFDVCFKTGEGAAERLRFPGLVFHFRGGIDLELPRENYMIGLEKEGVHCLGIMGIDGISVLGSYFQRDFWVDYDLKKNFVSFTPAKCVHG